jgi:hypothetical protein
MNRRSKPRTPLALQPLEAREVPATLVSPTTVTYRDGDGDAVKVVLTKKILTPANVNSVFVFAAGSVNGDNAVGQQINSINLTGVAGATRTGVAVTATAANGGDGFATVWDVVADGLDLGAVKVDGHLGRVVAGDADLKHPGLASLKSNTLGGTGNTTVTGGIGALTVAVDVVSTVVEVPAASGGRIGKVTIGGSLSPDGGGETAIRAPGIGNVTIGRDIEDATLEAGDPVTGEGKFGSVKVGRDLKRGKILLWGTSPGVTIGGDVIGGADFDAGSISVGSTPALTIGGSVKGGAVTGSGVIGAGDIGTLKIGGDLVGGGTDYTGVIEAVGAIGNLTVGGSVIGGSAVEDFVMTHSGTILANRIGRLTIAGDLKAGTDQTTGDFHQNGAVIAENDLGTVKIGRIVGNATHPALIMARGQIKPTATKDVAIGSLTVGGDVSYALILGGVDENWPANADAQIGNVFVGGNWTASSLSAGVDPTNGSFGDGDDAKLTVFGTRDNPKISSSIGSLTIVGQATGTEGGTDHYGIVAENVGTVTTGGTKLAQTAGNGNDNLVLGTTGDFRLREV